MTCRSPGEALPLDESNGFAVEKHRYFFRPPRMPLIASLAFLMFSPVSFVPPAGAAWLPALAPAGAPPTVKPGNDRECSKVRHLRFAQMGWKNRHPGVRPRAGLGQA